MSFENSSGPVTVMFRSRAVVSYEVSIVVVRLKTDISWFGVRLRFFLFLRDQFEQFILFSFQSVRCVAQDVMYLFRSSCFRLRCFLFLRDQFEQFI